MLDIGQTQPMGDVTQVLAEKEVQRFDLETYSARMAHYLAGVRDGNQLFFRALNFAYQLHAGQRRKSGAPYISHPSAVAEILLRELRLVDAQLLAAAILHDIVEDVQDVTLADIERHFGEAVADLVDGCTKLTRYHLDRSTLKDLTHSKIFVSASRRLGVVIIKLADRLHNLRTLHYLKQPKRQRIAQETVEVYAPIAAILNIATLKRELYHLALSHLYPRKSKKILNVTRGLRNAPEVLEIEAALKRACADLPCSVTVRPRVKGLGTYYDPLKRSLSLFNTENRVDFAIILESEDAVLCYLALGIVNALFTPVPRSLRDFVANPKNNGYQSLHVRSNIKGQNYLFKIRTPKMDQRAIYGILSEWAEHRQIADDHWQEISELLRSIGEYGGAGPQRKALIRSSESEDIFAYTPKGDIHYFPKGSVLLDFAYKIHSELGEHCQGALVNEKRVGPTYTLKDGDIVEVITSREPLEVDPALESLCKTPKARTALNKHLHQKRLKYAQEIGRQVLCQEFQRHGLSMEILEGEQARLVMEILNVKDLQDLLAHIGQDQLSSHLLLYYFTGDVRQNPHPTPRQASAMALPAEQNRIQMAELDNAIHKFARCCNPYPGQDNLFATISERGVTIHQRDCQELTRYGIGLQDLLEVTWNSTVAWPHPLTFHISVNHETIGSLLPRLAAIPSHCQIQTVTNKVDSHGEPYVELMAVIAGLPEAQELFAALPSGEARIEWYGRYEWWASAREIGE